MMHSKLNPDYALIYNLLGKCYWSKGLKQESLEYFQRATELDGKNSIFLLDFAEALYNMDKFEHAENILLKIIDTQKDQTAAYYILYHMYVTQERPEDAEKIKKEALKNGIDIEKLNESFNIITGPSSEGQ